MGGPKKGKTMTASKTWLWLRWSMALAILATAMSGLFAGCDEDNGKKPATAQATAAEVEIKPDDNQAGVNGDLVPSNKGKTGEKHYVSPKKASEFVLLKAVRPAGAQGNFGDIYEWDPAPAANTDVQAGASADKIKVKRDAAKKITVKIKRKNGGAVLDTLNVWLVWAELSGDIDATHTSIIDGTPLGLHGGRYATGYKPQAGIDWTATIAPATIITDADRPAIEGQTRVRPPGSAAAGDRLDKGVASDANKDATGSGFSGWDISRQVRMKAMIGNPLASAGASFWARLGYAQESYAGDDVEGNDDGSVGADEDSNPYDEGSGVPGKGAKGILRSNDEPGLGFPDGQTSSHTAPAANDDTARLHVHFREFVRVQIGSKWYRVSDWGEWRWHFNTKRVAGKWDAEAGQADILEKNNNGFDF